MTTFIGFLLAAILAVTSGTYITQGAFPLSDSIIAAVQDPENHQKIVEWVDSIGLDTDEAWASIMAQVEEIQAGNRDNVDLTGQQLVDILDKAVATMPDKVAITKPRMDRVYFDSPNISRNGILTRVNDLGNVTYRIEYQLNVYEGIRMYKIEDMSEHIFNIYNWIYDISTEYVMGSSSYVNQILICEAGSEADRAARTVEYDNTNYAQLAFDGDKSILWAYASSTGGYRFYLDADCYLSYDGALRMYYKKAANMAAIQTLPGYYLADYYDGVTKKEIDLQKDRDYLMQVITGLKKKLEEEERLAASVISIPVGQTAEQTDAIISSIAEALAAANANANVNTQALIDAIVKAQADAKAAEAEGELDMDLGKLRLGEAILTRFPFCIPFDLVNAIGAFSGLPRTPPKWVIPVNIWGTENTITIDFTQFEIWAKIIRWGVLICFNVGLIVVTRKLIKG